MVLVRKSTEREKGTMLGKAPDWSGSHSLCIKSWTLPKTRAAWAIWVDEMIFRKGQSEAIDCPGTWRNPANFHLPRSGLCTNKRLAEMQPEWLPAVQTIRSQGVKQALAGCLTALLSPHFPLTQQTPLLRQAPAAGAVTVKLEWHSSYWIETAPTKSY